MVATSKHFLGGSGGGRHAAPARAAGLRRHFRAPPAKPGATGGASTPGCVRDGLGDMRRDGADQGSTSSNCDPPVKPWGAEYALCLPGNETENSAAGAREGAGGVDNAGGGSRGLKRRRTLGVGSVAPKGLIRGLDRAISAGTGSRMLSKGSGDEGKPGRRSISLGGEGFCVSIARFGEHSTVGWPPLPCCSRVQFSVFHLCCVMW